METNRFERDGTGLEGTGREQTQLNGLNRLLVKTDNILMF